VLPVLNRSAVRFVTLLPCHLFINEFLRELVFKLRELCVSDLKRFDYIVLRKYFFLRSCWNQNNVYFCTLKNPEWFLLDFEPTIARKPDNLR